MAEHAEETLAARLVETYSDRLLRLAYSILNSVPTPRTYARRCCLSGWNIQVPLKMRSTNRPGWCG